MKSIFTCFILTMLILITAFEDSFSQIHWTKDTVNNPVFGPGPRNDWDGYSIYPSAMLYDGSNYQMWYAGHDSIYCRIGYATSNDGITWIKYDDPVTTNPPFSQSDTVMDVGAAGTWDSRWIYAPKVLFDGSTYQMWYSGFNGTNARIGYATSPNGTTWTKYSGNPVLDLGTSGNWDDSHVSSPSIIYDGGTYHMWYEGGQGSIVQIGYATSTDGIIWSKHPQNPVLEIGAPGSWDRPMLRNPEVIFYGGIYHMWYSGTPSLWNHKVGYAISPDGIAWTKYNDPVTTIPLYSASDPVMLPGPNGSWDDQFVVAGTVNLDSVNSMLKMGYGGGNTNGKAQIGNATSPVSILHVPGNYQTIQSAIDAASEGNLVLVAEGTYQENINFKGKAITVASYFYLDGDTFHISNTIIDGSNPSNPDSGSVVYFVSGEDTTSVLCGFTITGGSGTLISMTTEVQSGKNGRKIYDSGRIRKTGTEKQEGYRIGGGIFCHDVSGAKIINNHITKNRIAGDYAWGGGLEFWADNGYLIVENNHIFENRVSAYLGEGGSGGLDYWGDNVFAKIVGNFFERDSVIGQNYVYGGGICFSGNNLLASGNIVDNVFRENIVLSPDSSACGGAIMCYKTAVVEIRDNLFENNIAKNTNSWAEGGAIFINDWDVSGYGNKLLAGNDFISNLAISQNGDARGGALDINYTLATVTSNYFKHNTSEGVSARGGGIRTYRSSFEIDNNIFVENSSNLGGAVDVALYPQSGSKMTIINNTMVDNTATSSGNSIYVNGVQIIALNNILWGGDTNQIGTSGGGSIVIRYSDVKGGYSGTGNINTDPLFADTILYELSDSSPCIGAAADSVQIGGTWYYPPEYDYDGDPRPNPVDEYVDMGAQESDFPSGILSDNLDNLPSSFSLKQNYPNPFNPTTTIEFSIPKTEFVTLKVYNILGEEVAALVSDKLTAGKYKYDWNASRPAGIASGVYLYRIQAGNYIEVKKMILLR